MTDNFFPKKTDLVLDAYGASVCQDGLHWQPVFNRLAELYAARSILQAMRHIPVCKVCGEQATTVEDGKQVFITECLIKVEHADFSVLVPSIFLHLAQAHGWCLSAEAEKVVLDGDRGSYGRLAASRPKPDLGAPPELGGDGW